MMSQRMKPPPLSVEDELIGLFTSDQPGKKRWFGRKMRELPDDVQDRIWGILESRGYERPGSPAVKIADDNKPEEAPAAPGRTVIIWSDEEWDRLADIVWGIRKNDPADSLVSLCRRAVDQFPQNRRRNIRVNNEIKPLIERLKALDKRYAAAEEKLQEAEARNKTLDSKLTSLTDQLANVPTREHVLSTATDEEVVVFYGDRVLDLLAPDDVLKRYDHETLMSYIPVGELVGSVVRMGVEMYMENQNKLGATMLAILQQQKTSGPAANGSTTKPAHGRPSMPVPRPITTPKLAKVTVLGLLPEQARVVESRLKGRASFTFVDKNRNTADSIPNGQDIIVLAANFISHSTQDQVKKKVVGTSTRIVIHHGGTDMMVRKLDDLLPLEFVS